MAISFVLRIAVYIPSTPMVGNVNNGNGENNLIPVESSGFFSKPAMRSAPKNSAKEKIAPKPRNIKVSLFMSNFCCPVFNLGMK